MQRAQSVEMKFINQSIAEINFRMRDAARYRRDDRTVEPPSWP
jgi:hypothetical protein